MDEGSRTEQTPQKGYGRGTRKKWIWIYLAAAVVVYAIVYFVFFYGGGGSGGGTGGGY